MCCVVCIALFRFAFGVRAIPRHLLTTGVDNEIVVSHATVARSFAQMWGGVMGASEFDVYDNSHYQALVWVLYGLFTFIVIIVMLNLLIALMGDSYERVNNQKEQARQLELAGIVVDTETQMRLSSRDRRTGAPNPEWQRFFPKWIHTLYDPSPNKSGTTNVWTSRTRMITNAVADSAVAIREHLVKEVGWLEGRGVCVYVCLFACSCGPCMSECQPENDCRC